MGAKQKRWVEIPITLAPTKSRQGTDTVWYPKCGQADIPHLAEYAGLQTFVIEWIEKDLLAGVLGDGVEIELKSSHPTKNRRTFRIGVPINGVKSEKHSVDPAKVIDYDTFSGLSPATVAYFESKGYTFITTPPVENEVSEGAPIPQDDWREYVRQQVREAVAAA